MFTHYRAGIGYPKNLFGERRFEFSPGLNTLFGQNGSGKSTILAALRKYSACPERGWTTYPHMESGLTVIFEYNKEKKKKLREKPFPDHLSGLKADVGWDGALAYSATLDRGSNMDEILSDPLVDPSSFALSFGGASSGEHKLARLGKLEAALKDPPNPVEEARKKINHVNNVWAEKYQRFIQYIESLPRTGPMTLLLDEPDRSISLTGQEGLWKSYFPRLAERYQIIVASHSPFVFFSRGNNIISMDEAYSRRAYDALSHLSDLDYMTPVSPR